ncbi:MAG: hypothetical protein HOE11_04685 [Candidatus Diapherotrites archaeon]|jgi:hypothetical protein|nr:hypothetical protein [Candidatus Diapherotrites archaeon]MBT4597175.1 hypothetical protein [Candidatus Diapherotrites archaeon]
MPPPHRVKAQKALDKINGVASKDAQAAINFGYIPTTHIHGVKKNVVSKARTLHTVEKVNEILSEVGISITKKQPIDIKTAQKFVASAKRVFGESPKLLPMYKAYTRLQSNNSIMTLLIRNRLITFVTLERGSKVYYYFDKQTLATEIRDPKVKAFLMAKVKGKHPLTIKRREALIEQLQANAPLLLKE